MSDLRRFIEAEIRRWAHRADKVECEQVYFARCWVNDLSQLLKDFDAQADAIDSLEERRIKLLDKCRRYDRTFFPEGVDNLPPH